ncbi:hypothetical protein JBL43_13690 [Aureibaculum sp. A20]|uniref:DUF4974 domain-containing protein n=1 Tax=Aureibaculum flavum TaxID=2795986 RepID=A0ABS0WTJ9_9FLAO|nr:hypothetical protein [Aureibaculum flavum]MBJ2175301.1 hypothetical protein [Aureibaculum flavum]
MNPTDKYHFNQLKKAITLSYFKENVASESIENWKGEEISAFQEDLLQKQKSSISEKWFYTYIKKEADKLPRIDILNLLSAYAGYQNWHTLKTTFPDSTIKVSKWNNKFYFLLLFPILALVFYFTNKKNEFQFCFIDQDKNESVTSVLDIKIIHDFESPIYLKTDSLGCFTYKTKEKNIRFVVQSPYFKTDTVYRNITTQANNTINLNTDDYALMLQYYANGNVQDLKNRKKQLQNLIADDAQIYQVFSQNNGVEIYAKEDFINKLIVPTSSLKKLKVLSKTYIDGKIIKLKFIIR